MPGIGIGISPLFGGKGGINWATREPSGVAATITSPTTATVVWTDSAVLGADGYKIYAGVTLKATVAVGAQTASVTGLTAATEYIFKVVAYKGAEESTGDTDTQTTWDAVFTGLAAAWPLSESGMRRDVLGSGIDFFPNGATSDGDFTITDGTNDHIACEDGAYKLTANGDFTMAFTLKPTTMAGTLYIITKGIYSNASACEWYLYHSSTQLYFRMNNGVADTTVTDAANRLSNGVATKVVVGKDVTNGLISIKIGDNAPVTAVFAQSSVPSLGGIVIGCAASYGSYYKGAIKDLMIWNGTYLTAAQQSTLYGLSFPTAALAAQAATLNPDDLDSKYSRHDFSDLTTQFTDTAKTTPVASDNDPIRVIESLWGSHDWVAPSDAVRPLHKANILGGLGVGIWNGTDTELDFDASVPGDNDITIIIIAQNSDNTSVHGSQILQNIANSVNYLSLTGADYGAGAYAAMHTSTTQAVGTPAPTNNPTGFNIIEIIREGSYYKITQCGKITWTNEYQSRTGDILFDVIGREHAAGWWFDGYLAEMNVFTRKLTLAERSRIRAFLTAKWTLLNIQYYHG
jgi:hypothetical protein